MRTLASDPPSATPAPASPPPQPQQHQPPPPPPPQQHQPTHPPAAPLLARQISSPAPSVSTTPAAGSGLAQRLGAAELEELYEGLIGRLRRELLLERERMGNLFGL
ncbi:MAG TPA: hypothetical protein VG186_07525 [Solirubrobacteraceae bacterium]|jgi:hypothetical protein|nr:hypothetical protein [Solirubrobacteraceae bacterium]